MFYVELNNTSTQDKSHNIENYINLLFQLLIKLKAMKKLITSGILATALILIGLLLFSNCNKDSDSNSSYNCLTETIAGESVEACCTPTDCYYEWNGNKYYCNGIDCNDAATKLVEDIILGGGKSLPIDSDTKAKLINKLLNLER